MTTLLQDAAVFDGTGSPARPAGVLIDGDLIVAVGPLEPPADAEVIDCTGLAVAPGFVDAHSHSDLQVLENRGEKVRQGVTAEVVGNCGFSPYPLPHEPRLLREFANGILAGGSAAWGWRNAAEYLAKAAASNVGVLSLTGHGSLRIAVAGNRLGPLEEPDLSRMEGLLDEALSGGACGFSTGLNYAPGESAPFSELERLCTVVARRGKVYATHMRDYAGKLVEAVEEQLELARRTGCRLQISHMQAVGPRNWPSQAPALERIEKARREGIDVMFDCYPYTAGSTVMTQLLPQWVLEGGTARMVERLADPAERRGIARETDAALAQTWDDIIVSAVGSERNRPLIGLSVAAIAAARGCAPAEAAVDIVREEGGDVNVVEFNQSEENLRQTLTHPLSLIISDGFYVKGKPHPRLWGTFPRLLGEMCRERRWLALEEAVAKITDAPARRFGLSRRGRIEPGFFADIAVFDPAAVGSPATYEQPEQPPNGVRYVFRNGRRQSL